MDALKQAIKMEHNGENFYPLLYDRAISIEPR